MSELEKAAVRYAQGVHYILLNSNPRPCFVIEAFSAGASWQKEHDSQELKLLRRVAEIAAQGADWSGVDDLDNALEAWRAFQEKIK